MKCGTWLSGKGDGCRQTSVGGLPVNVDNRLEQEAASLAAGLEGPEG